MTPEATEHAMDLLFASLEHDRTTDLLDSPSPTPAEPEHTNPTTERD